MVNDSEIAAGLAPTPGYRYADRSGSQLFVAGQVPLDRDGVLVGRGSPAEQAVQCLDNLRILVEVHGFTIGDVRQLKIYVVGPHQHLLDAWGAVAGWFDGMVPPATLVGVNLLGYTDQLVEMTQQSRAEPRPGTIQLVSCDRTASADSREMAQRCTKGALSTMTRAAR